MALNRIDEVWTRGDYIVFRNMGTRGKHVTNVYEVTAASDNYLLGRIVWFTRWRKYIYQPTHDTIYEENCLRDIAQFILEETKSQKERAKARKAAKA